ncbi:MAG: NAD(P)/FAD-dependent oxidoreductase [Caulobacter sp.]|nr:NAD(P)/FAD-dependent oxidoreductase [Caulobacter sp.]
MADFDVLIVGAGAAGMMCAVQAGRRGRSVLIVDHAQAPGEKIRISGGGRCNFTNFDTRPAAFLSQNPRFCISALKRYTQHDFIAAVDARGIAWHEKTLGQLFCDGSAKQIIEMLTDDMAEAGVELRLSTAVDRVTKTADGFEVALSNGAVARCASLVVATGGKSIPKMGATGWAYDIARQFGLAVTETRPALVPLTFEVGALERIKPLAGMSVDAVVSHGKTRFAEAMLFTHRGLSGPAILQISSYWREGQAITVSMAPGADIFDILKSAKLVSPRQSAHNALTGVLPIGLARLLCEEAGARGNLADTPDKVLRAIDAAVNQWTMKPVGSEGYRTAEVTLGGIDTRQLSSNTMQVESIPGLFFIGEAVDVTGWLGGYNFQWAWSSGWAAGQAV